MPVFVPSYDRYTSRRRCPPAHSLLSPRHYIGRIVKELDSTQHTTSDTERNQLRFGLHSVKKVSFLLSCGETAQTGVACTMQDQQAVDEPQTSTWLKHPKKTNCKAVLSIGTCDSASCEKGASPLEVVVKPQIRRGEESTPSIRGPDDTIASWENSVAPGSVDGRMVCRHNVQSTPNVQIDGLGVQKVSLIVTQTTDTELICVVYDVSGDVHYMVSARQWSWSVEGTVVHDVVAQVYENGPYGVESFGRAGCVAPYGHVDKIVVSGVTSGKENCRLARGGQTMVGKRHMQQGRCHSIKVYREMDGDPHTCACSACEDEVSCASCSAHELIEQAVKSHVVSVQKLWV